MALNLAGLAIAAEGFNKATESLFEAKQKRVELEEKLRQAKIDNQVKNLQLKKLEYELDPITLQAEKDKAALDLKVLQNTYQKGLIDLGKLQIESKFAQDIAAADVEKKIGEARKATAEAYQEEINFRTAKEVESARPGFENAMRAASHAQDKENAYRKVIDQYGKYKEFSDEFKRRQPELSAKFESTLAQQLSDRQLVIGTKLRKDLETYREKMKSNPELVNQYMEEILAKDELYSQPENYKMVSEWFTARAQEQDPDFLIGAVMDNALDTFVRSGQKKLDIITAKALVSRALLKPEMKDSRNLLKNRVDEIAQDLVRKFNELKGE